MPVTLILSLGILLASFGSTLTGDGTPLGLLAEVSGAAITSPTPQYTVTVTPREIRQGGNYAFTARVSRARPNSPVVFFLQRPDGTLKYGPADDVIQKIANPATNRQGSWSSPRTVQVVSSDAPTGTYTSWVAVGGVESNRLTHIVLPHRGELTSFEGNASPSGRVFLTIQATRVSQLKLRLTCPSGVSAENANESSASDFCGVEQELPGSTASLSLQLKNESQTAKQVTFRLSAIDEDNRIVGIKIVRLRVLPIVDDTALPSEPPIPTATSTSSKLLVSLDASTPSAHLVTAGTANHPLTVLKVIALGEEIRLQSIALQLETTNVGSISRVTLWDGGAKVGEAVFSIGQLTQKVTLASPVVIPKDGDKLLVIKADIGGIGIGGPARVGDSVAVNFDAQSPETKGVGSSSGLAVVRSLELQDTTAASARIFKSYPTLVKLPIPSNSLADGTMVLYRFSASAASSGDVGLGKMTFRITARNVRSNIQRLYGYSDPGFSIQAYHANPLNTETLQAGNDQYEVYFNPLAQLSSTREAIHIPAGTTRYFELRSTITKDSPQVGLEVSLLGDDAEIPVSTLSGTEQQQHNNFIWAGSSTTTALTPATVDWINGHLMPGLPSSEMAPQVFEGGTSVASTSLTVLSPNGGETWPSAGQITDTISGFGTYRRDITWTGAPNDFGAIHDGIVKAYLEKHESGQYVTVGRIPPFAFGSIAWVVGVVGNESCGPINGVDPNGCFNRNNMFLVPAGQYYVRVVNTQTGTWDRSDAPLGIVVPDGAARRVEVNYASGNRSSYTAGEKISLAVRGVELFDGSPGEPSEGFNVQVYLRGVGDSYNLQGGNAVYNARTGLWETQLVAPVDTSKTYNVEAAFYCSNGSLVCGSRYPEYVQVGKSFTFQPTGFGVQPVNVLSPDGRETYQAGQAAQMPIQWAADCKFTSFGLLLVKGSSVVKTINDSVPSGICSPGQTAVPYYTTWPIPADLSAGDDYKLLLYGYPGDGFIGDLSNASFAIASERAAVPLSVDLKVNSSDGPVAVHYSVSGINATLAWTSTGAVSCTRNWGIPSRPAAEPQGTYDAGGFLAAGGSRTYTLTCMDAAGNSASDSVVLTAKVFTTLNVSLHSSSPRAAMVNPGQAGVTFAKVAVNSATGRDGNRTFGVTRIKLVSDPSADEVVHNVQFIGDSRVIADSESYEGGGVYRVSNFALPPGYLKVITIKADIKPEARGSLRLGISEIRTTDSAAEVTIEGGAVYGNQMTVRDETVRDPLTLSAAESEVPSGYATQFSISSDANRVARMELVVRCPRNMSAPGAEGEQCGRVQSLTSAIDGYSIKFLNLGSSLQSVVVTLRGYNGEGRLVATRLATLRVRPVIEIFEGPTGNIPPGQEIGFKILARGLDRYEITIPCPRDTLVFSGVITDSMCGRPIPVQGETNNPNAPEVYARVQVTNLTTSEQRLTATLRASSAAGQPFTTKRLPIILQPNTEENIQLLRPLLLPEPVASTTPTDTSPSSGAESGATLSDSFLSASVVAALLDQMTEVLQGLSSLVR
ncbi:MAG: hypothetical protein HY471_03095 [Candidatus Sungbacteria bacterium]|nr:hypothetical protein [Candidatus Sungbacteria bacterium]